MMMDFTELIVSFFCGPVFTPACFCDVDATSGSLHAPAAMADPHASEDLGLPKDLGLLTDEDIDLVFGCDEDRSFLRQYEEGVTTQTHSHHDAVDPSAQSSPPITKRVHGGVDWNNLTPEQLRFFLEEQNSQHDGVDTGGQAAVDHLPGQYAQLHGGGVNWYTQGQHHDFVPAQLGVLVPDEARQQNVVHTGEQPAVDPLPAQYEQHMNGMTWNRDPYGYTHGDLADQLSQAARTLQQNQQHVGVELSQPTLMRTVFGKTPVYYQNGEPVQDAHDQDEQVRFSQHNTANNNSPWLMPTSGGPRQTKKRKTTDEVPIDLPAEIVLQKISQMRTSTRRSKKIAEVNTSLPRVRVQLNVNFPEHDGFECFLVGRGEIVIPTDEAVQKVQAYYNKEGEDNAKVMREVVDILQKPHASLCYAGKMAQIFSHRSTLAYQRIRTHVHCTTDGKLYPIHNVPGFMDDTRFALSPEDDIRFWTALAKAEGHM